MEAVRAGYAASMDSGGQEGRQRANRSAAPPGNEIAPPQTEITLTVNGKSERLTVDNRASLLDVLRERLGQTGTKKGCDHGQCGACTILLNGRRVNSCLVFAVAQDGARITTVEGLADGDGLHPLQATFIERDAFQCGYCTPGQLCSAVGMLAEAAAGWPSMVTREGGPEGQLGADEIRERMSGNLCRCGAYPNIVAAIMDVAAQGEEAAIGDLAAVGDEAATGHGVAGRRAAR
jgi:xanthine dehydrogenase YagT iron-sulfur-binding subunit